MSKSNANGRALEYIIVKDLIDSYQALLSDNCKYMQLRDENYFDNLLPPLKNKYTIATSKITKWLNDNYDVIGSKLDRLDDNQAKSKVSDVTDIRINNKVNISIKHNHNALKHQRPGALAQQCSFPRKSKQDLEFREKYKLVTKEFISNANKVNPDISLFSELKSLDVNFINRELYKPVCELVASFINEEVSMSIENVRFLFKFIVGNTDFLKIVVNQSHIEIYEFSKIPSPNSVIASVKNDSYVNLIFDNGWNISMRLHTASSRLKTVSLKFDSQLDGLKIKPVIIEI